MGAKYWTKEKCHKISLKYKTKKDFRKNNQSIYITSYNNNWLDEICTHMKPIGNRYKRCIYSIEFENNCVYIGLTYNYDKRINEHLTDNRSTVFKFIKKTKLKPNCKMLSDYISVEMSILEENNYINMYKNNGWFIINKNKGGAIGSKTIKWTKNKCQTEALKYKHRVDFLKKSYSAYESARKNNWLDEICSHMVYLIKPKNYWTKEKCKTEALKYNNKTDFKNNNNGAYCYSYKNNFLNEICKHMQKKRK